MIVMIDNYDSFVYNLVQYLGEMGEQVTVFRNDEITVPALAKLSPSHIIISPGPCTPDEAGISLAVIRYFCGYVPILGVCLGHQAIGQAFGGKVIRAARPMHGKTSVIKHDGQGLFYNVPNPLAATRYHSLIVERETLPGCLQISAETSQGEIMGLRHREYGVEGVQFHPESILTQSGREMLRNFLHGRMYQKREGA